YRRPVRPDLPGDVLLHRGRGAARLSVVQRAPGRSIHGRHWVAGAGGDAGDRGDDAWPGAAAADHRLRVRRRSIVGHAPGAVLQDDRRTPTVSHGAAAPPLRDDGLERNAGRTALLVDQHGEWAVGGGACARLSKGPAGSSTVSGRW